MRTHAGRGLETEGRAPGLGPTDAISSKGRFVTWWTDDLPPLSGPLRFVFYGGLLFVTCFSVANPVRGILAYEATDPRMFRIYGLLELLQVPYLPVDVVRGMIAVTVVAWIFAAVGFLSRLSAVVTAAGILCLHGLFLGTNALNHNWFLPVYACIALCFARTNDRWSVDHFLTRGRGGRAGVGRAATGPAPPALADTGFARKLVLVAAAGFYFASGFTKLATSGWKWTDGHTIAYFGEQRRSGYPFAGFVADHVDVAALLSALTLALETGAILMLVSRRVRWVWVPGLVFMHVGIRVSLGPAYWENVLCVALLLDWRRILSKVDPGGLFLRSAPLSAIGAAAPPRGALAGAVGGTLFLLLLLGVAVFRVFWWPLTHVYMYSTYYSIPHDIRANQPTRDYERTGSAQRIARDLIATGASMDEAEYFMYRIRVRLVAEGSDPLYLTDHLGVYSWKQWALTIGGPVLVQDLAAKPPGRIEFDPRSPENPAQLFLLRFAPVLRERLPRSVREGYERIELSYPLETGEAILASVTL